MRLFLTYQKPPDTAARIFNDVSHESIENYLHNLRVRIWVKYLLEIETF